MNILSYLKEKTTRSEDKNRLSGAYESKKNELKKFIDDQYSFEKKQEVDDVPSYQRYEYEAPSDESLRSSVREELSDYLRSGESSIRDEYAARAKALEESKKQSEQLLGDSTERLKATYGEAAQTLSNDSLRRGLARSSIALNNQAEASKAYESELSELISERDRKISEINDELNSLDASLKNALDSFKIGYAAKLTERINELKDEREKNIKEAIEYNNSLLSKEHEQRLAKQKAESDLYADALASQKKLDDIYKSNTGRTETEQKIFDKISEVLSSLPREEARRLVGDDLIKNSLNEADYYILYTKYR